MEGYDSWKTTDRKFEQDERYAARLEACMHELENTAMVVVDVLANDYSGTENDHSDALEARAHLTDSDEDWTAYIAERKRMFAAAIRARAKAICDAEEYESGQRAYNWLAAKTGGGHE